MKELNVSFVVQADIKIKQAKRNVLIASLENLVLL
jgi:hypothetical protein